MRATYLDQPTEPTTNAELQFAPSGDLTAISLNTKSEREQEALELALARVLRPRQGEMLRRSLKRFLVLVYCCGLIPKGFVQSIFDLLRLRSL